MGESARNVSRDRRTLVDMANVCPTCGAELPAARTCQEMCDELNAYTLEYAGAEFVHQHLVDAYAAQHISRDSKPVKQAAALVGLYLFVERGYTGRQVQQAHMALGNKMKQWTLWEPPCERAGLTVMDPLKVPAGVQRDEAIKQWARAVWTMWGERHGDVEEWLRGAGFVPE